MMRMKDNKVIDCINLIINEDLPGERRPKYLGEEDDFTVKWARKSCGKSPCKGYNQ
jgi:hypothetical protein